VQTGSGTHPAFYPRGVGCFFLGVKRPEHEVDHSPSFSVDVKNAWNIISIPPISLHNVVLRHRDKITLYLPGLRNMCKSRVL
jgi:hypothetical protein